MDQAALTLVDCRPMSARLTETSCARRWRAAQDTPPGPFDSLRHCHTCQVGALRAGFSASVAVNAAIATALGRVCPRCERPAARLIHGRTCVSCYNRTAEAVRGFNAKGTRPRLADVIHGEALAVGGRVIQVDRVASRIEAAAIAARQTGPGAIIGVPPLVLPLRGWQASLYLPMPARCRVPALERREPGEPGEPIARLARRRASPIPLIRMMERAAAA